MTKSTYVNVSRQDLESWLDSVVASSPRYKSWQSVRGTAGIYLIHLSEFVSVKVSTTLTGLDSVKGKGKASTKLTLVSRLFPRMVLNRKSNKQNSFYRTMNWKITWKKGIDHLVANSYATKADFYDNVARIENRDEYKRDKIKAIESINGWSSKPYLVKYHQSLTSGFILWPNQEKVIEDILAKQSNRPQTDTQTDTQTTPQWGVGSIPMYDVDQLRRLYVAMRDYRRRKSEEMTFGDVSINTAQRYLTQLGEELAWVAEFGKKQVAGQRPTAQEVRKVDGFLKNYRVI
jgi:hypothetical protein